jgi:hypothetical protein
MEVDGAIKSYPNLIEKACDYVTAQKKVVGTVWSQRAYYYDIALDNIRQVRSRCPDW